MLTTWISSLMPLWPMPSTCRPYFSYRPSIRDPDDEIFVSVSVNGRADALVTFNIADYAPIDERETDLGIVVCRPGDILRRLTWRPSATLPFAFPRR